MTDYYYYSSFSDGSLISSNLNGNYIYPTNNGFAYSIYETLNSGAVIQRAGSLHVSFVALADIPQEMLSMPPDKFGLPNSYFKVNEGCSVNVISGPAVPWFGQPGGGIQYYLLDGNVQTLIDKGVLIPLGGN